MLRNSVFLVVLLLINGRLGHCDDHEDEVTSILDLLKADVEDPVEAVEPEVDESSEEVPSQDDPLKSLEDSMFALLNLNSNETEQIKADILSELPKPRQRFRLVVPSAKGAMKKGMSGARRMQMSPAARQPQGKSPSQRLRFWAEKCTKQNPFCEMSAQECLDLFPGMEAYATMNAMAKRFLDCCRCHVNFKCKFPIDDGNDVLFG